MYEPEYVRVAIKAITQYGKSDTVAIAAICLCCIPPSPKREKILIVAPSGKQAHIIMNDVIDHLFDSKMITKMLDFPPGSLDRLKQERSKNRITFINGREIYTLTADADTITKEAKTLMGFGATTVIADESSLIPDVMFSKILRMVGGVQNGKLVKLGNPFEKNHFARAFTSKRYYAISIDWKQAVKEGRITEDFVEEAREEMPPLDFKIFYDCEFPEGGAEDALIPPEWIELAVAQYKNGGVGGEKKQSGIDVARFGRDASVYAHRVGGDLRPLKVERKMDTMQVSGWAGGLIEQDEPEITNVDVIGIGAGVYDRLDEMGYAVAPINVGASPTDEEKKQKFYNLRAEIFWHLREVFRPENGRSSIAIPDDPELKQELGEIRYKYSSERKIKIEEKDDMKRRIGRSPDKADAVALAFAENLEESPDISFG